MASLKQQCCEDEDDLDGEKAKIPPAKTKPQHFAKSAAKSCLKEASVLQARVWLDQRRGCKGHSAQGWKTLR